MRLIFINLIKSQKRLHSITKDRFLVIKDELKSQIYENENLLNFMDKNKSLLD